MMSWRCMDAVLYQSHMRLQARDRLRPSLFSIASIFDHLGRVEVIQRWINLKSVEFVSFTPCHLLHYDVGSTWSTPRNRRDG